MIHKTELFTIHILDLLALLHAAPSSEGSVRLIVGGEEHAEADFDELCLVIQTVTERDLFDASTERETDAPGEKERFRTAHLIPFIGKGKGRGSGK